MNQPALARVRRGTCTIKLIQAHNITEKVRVLSGSALSGDLADPDSPTGFLGSRANQMCVLSDAPEKEFVGWANPIGSRHTFTHTALGKLFRKKHKYDTNMNGSHRAIVPIGSWEEVMPMDIMPTQLIKALASGDLEMSEKLGVLEVAEEDLALCEYLDQSKTEVTSLLRDMLTQIEREG
jgi:Na+-transporting NADH:ubiquinone oxidoreductase subunit A